MIRLKKLTGVLLLLSSCNSLQGNISRMNDKRETKKEFDERKATEAALTSLAYKSMFESKSASNDRGNYPSHYRKETIGPAPPEWVQRQRNEEARNQERDEERAEAMLQAYAVGDVVSSKGDITGCSVM